MRDFLTQTIVEAGKLAGSFFLGEFGSRAKSNPADIVTEADEAVSDLLVQSIHTKYPLHHVHSEELSADINPGAEYCWVIDPIDGTRNFAAGIPAWCVMVALLRSGSPYMAAVYHPLVDQLFFAEIGKGATLNGRPIGVNSCASLDYCLGIIVSDRAHGVEIERFNRALINYVKSSSGWLNNYGTMYLACLLAAGKVDFYMHNSGQDYDYLAPALICREAGAIVSNSWGEAWQAGRRDIVIANPRLHSGVLQLFSDDPI